MVTDDVIVTYDAGVVYYFLPLFVGFVCSVVSIFVFYGIF